MKKERATTICSSSGASEDPESSSSSTEADGDNSGVRIADQFVDHYDAPGPAVSNGLGHEGCEVSCNFAEDRGMERHTLVRGLGFILSHLSSLATRRTDVTRFSSASVPRLCIADYFERIARYFRCSDASLTASIMYIDRIKKWHPEFQVSTWNIHRLVLTAVTVSVKFHDDAFYTDVHYAKVGGLSAHELIRLETEFLVLLRWRLHISPEQYLNYCERVEKAVSVLDDIRVFVPKLCGG